MLKIKVSTVYSEAKIIYPFEMVVHIYGVCVCVCVRVCVYTRESVCMSACAGYG